MSDQSDEDSEAQQTSVVVVARLRPPDSTAGPSEITVSRRFGQQKHVQVRNLEFSLDWVLDVDATQEDVFEVVEGSLPLLLEGYKVTLVAYGQTGSGKTHTMFGPQEVLERFETAARSQYGCVPRACAQLFSSLDDLPTGTRSRVECTYLEVYNGAVNDLLTARKNLILRETAERGLYVDGLSKEVVGRAQEVMAALQRGNANRVVAAMKMNERSSRGHAIFSVTLQLAAADEEDGAVSSRLDFVDLAGMESSKKSYAVEGASNNPMRREEAKNINTSLYALGSVVERLSAGGSSHIPFRDSKLTRLLQDSLSGSCSVTMIVTLRTEPRHVDETIGTLRFAQRAKAIPVRLLPSSAPRGEAGELRALLETMRMELSESKRTAEKLQMQLDRQAMEGSSAAAGDGVPTDEVLRLQHQNRLLRMSLLMHRVMGVHHADALDTLRADHAEEIQRLRDLGAAPAAQRSATQRSLGRFSKAPPTPWSSVSPRKLRRRFAAITEEQRGYEKFELLATARKLALASRGYEVMNVFIDELYDCAIKERQREDQWYDFLRQRIPSPDATRARATDQLPSVQKSASHIATLRRFTMPFASTSTDALNLRDDEQDGSPEGSRMRSDIQAGTVSKARGLQLHLDGEEEWRSKVVLGTPRVETVASVRSPERRMAGADNFTRVPDSSSSCPRLAKRATEDAIVAARKAAVVSANAREAAAKALAAAAATTTNSPTSPQTRTPWGSSI